MCHRADHASGLGARTEGPVILLLELLVASGASVEESGGRRSRPRRAVVVARDKGKDLRSPRLTGACPSAAATPFFKELHHRQGIGHATFTHRYRDRATAANAVEQP